MTRIRWRRMRLRRADGRVYLDRWGFETPIGRVLLHRMDAPDPGVDLHDHPWHFWSLILKGGYVEERCDTREAGDLAKLAEAFPETAKRGVEYTWRPGSLHAVRLDECHRITRLLNGSCWTLVVGAPRRRRWGFYVPGDSTYMGEAEYDRTVRASRRDLWNEDPATGQPEPQNGVEVHR